MRKETISYHVAGLARIVEALGKFKGDPYDEAVKRLSKPAKKPVTKTKEPAE